MTSPTSQPGVGRFIFLERLGIGHAAAMAGGLAVAAHLGTFGNAFVGDGAFLTVFDPGIQDLSRLPGRLLEPSWPGPSSQEVGAWRPVATATYALLWALGGGSPAVFHLGSVLLHGLATALVVLVLARVLPPATAAAAGLLFAVHPVHVEAVANVPGVSELWATIFVLGACLIHTRPGAYTLTRALGVALCYALGIMAKEGAAVLPLLLLIVDAARSRMGMRKLPAYLRRTAPLYALLTAVLAAVLVGRFAVLGSFAETPPPYGMEQLKEMPRVWTVAQGWAHVARLLVWPADLSVIYAPRLLPVAYGWTPMGFTGAGLALLVLAGAWVGWRRGEEARWTAPATLWVVAALLPVANVFYLSPVIVAERNLYLPSVAAVGLLAGALVALERWRPPLGAAFCAVLVVLGGARSALRVADWRDEATLMERHLERHPESGFGWVEMGSRLMQADRPREALRAYQVGVGMVGLRYDKALALASHLSRYGRLESARFFLRRAWRERPDQYQAPTLLADVALRLGRPHEAAAAARAAAALRPDNPSTHHLLASALRELGDVQGAAEAQRRALRAGFRPAARAWALLASDLLEAGDAAGAAAALAEAEAALPGAGDQRAELERLLASLQARLRLR